jgi:hypothetical protein
MSLADVREQSTPDPRGDVRFLGSSARVRLRSAVEASGWMLVMMQPLGPGARGQLSARIEEAIEEGLERRGAAAPGVGADVQAPRMLEDQLYRAQQVGIKGLIVALESLSGLVGPHGALGDEDSACLRFWSSAAAHHPVALWLSPTDMGLQAYGPPVALKTLLNAKAETDLPAEPEHLPRAKTLGGGGWRPLVKMIDDAQGPKPLSAIEKLFVEAYVPLAELVRSGEEEKRAKESLERFSVTFEKSYKEAFAAAKVTKKRPQMVLDVPQISSRIARLHGARTTTLVLVDGMRYDVGLRLEPLLHEELRGKAVMAERVLLWAALPAVTSAQLKLMAKGPQGLTDQLDTPEMREQEMPMGRGRTASTVRRIRVGGREVHKLDVVQADLTASGLPERERLDALAQAVAYPLVQLASTLPARTLMFVFGDHGFVLPSSNGGTGPAERPGARPEEVLVPGQAWVLGGVH